MRHVSQLHSGNTQPIAYYQVVSNKKIDTLPESLIKNKSPDLFSHVNIEQDYIDLFSYAKKGHIGKYIYMHRPHIYENAIKQDAYYPFRMERDLLLQKADQMSLYLSKVTEVIEIGPGSYTPIISKSIPFLKILEHHSSFSTYTALDSNLEYAKQACQIVQRELPTLKTEAIEIDFLSKNGFEKTKNDSKIISKKLLFSFGQPIFANNNDEDVIKFLHNIWTALGVDDYLLFGVDTNKDKNMLEAAYNREIVRDLLLNTMHYLKNTLNLKNFNPEAFDSIYKWNHEECTVEHYLKPKIKQTLKIRDQKFIIDTNNEFNILNSRKRSLSKIKNFLSEENMQVKEIFSSPHNKISIIIAKKTPILNQIENSKLNNVEVISDVVNRNQFST